jgi:hypothetical protein
MAGNPKQVSSVKHRRPPPVYRVEQHDIGHLAIIQQ